MNIYNSNLVGKFCLIYDEKDIYEKIELYKNEDAISLSGRWFADKFNGLLRLIEDNSDIKIKQIKCEIVFINDEGLIKVKMPNGKLLDVPEWQTIYILD